MFKNKKTKLNDVEKCQLAVKDLRKIIEKSSELVHVFQLDSDESSHDIELAILRVFINCN